MLRTIRFRVWRLLRVQGSRLTRKQKGLVLLLLLIAFLLLQQLFQRWMSSYDDYILDMDDDEGEVEIPRPPGASMPKWIVCTTVRPPTEALRQLSTQLKGAGWQMVVVGDRRTPANWNIYGVIYLGIKAQKHLGYRVHNLLPYDSYTRKMIGYLYAIQHGAKYIYEVDDDNYPITDLFTFRLPEPGPNKLHPYLMVDTNNLTYNPYPHFGQSTVWPRGYPLERIGHAQAKRYRLCNMRAPSVQQGVVDGDPDVDAIFRLTRRSSSTPLNLTFDHAAPPVVVPSGTFSPYNSQNTLFTHSALWSLVLPTSVDDRVTDIYRAYWAEKLLWLVGGHVAFVSPSARQTRYGHSDARDARDEREIYENINRYIQTLQKWNCEHELLYDCVSQLTKHLVREGFWKSRDAEIIDAWISDLASVGYAPPTISEATPTEACLTNQNAPVTFYPVEQKTAMNNSPKNRYAAGNTGSMKKIPDVLSSLCGNDVVGSWMESVNKATKYPNILLVISIKSELTQVVPLIEAVNRPHFPNILYCVGQDASVDKHFTEEWQVSVIRLSSPDPAAASCLQAAGDMGYNANGVLHMPENVWLNSDGPLSKKIRMLMWLTGDFVVYNSEVLNQCAAKTINCQLMQKDLPIQLANQIARLDEKWADSTKKKSLRDCVSKLEKDPHWTTQVETVWITDLVAYIPTRFHSSLSHLLALFRTSPDLEAYDFVSLLLLECQQVTLEYLTHSYTQLNPAVAAARAEAGEAIAAETDYIYPFIYTRVKAEAKEREQYCLRIIQPNA